MISLDKIDTDRLDPDQGLAGSGVRDLGLLYLQDLGAAVGVDADEFQGCSLRGTR